MLGGEKAREFRSNWDNNFRGKTMTREDLVEFIRNKFPQSSQSIIVINRIDKLQIVGPGGNHRLFLLQALDNMPLKLFITG